MKKRCHSRVCFVPNIVLWYSKIALFRHGNGEKITSVLLWTAWTLIKSVGGEKNWIVCCPDFFSASFVNIGGFPTLPNLVQLATALIDDFVRFASAFLFRVTVWNLSSSKLTIAASGRLFCSNLDQTGYYLLAMLAIFICALFFFWRILQSRCQAVCPFFPQAAQFGVAVVGP